MAAPTRSRPGRALVALALALVALFAAVAASVQWHEPKGQWAPKLGLDLEGGTSITLLPRSTNASSVNDENITQAVQIIRQRVDSFGVAEAEVAAQGTGGSRNILISVPGKQGGNILDLVRQTAELRFRRVLLDAPAGIAPAPAPVSSATPGATKSPSPSGKAKSSPPAKQPPATAAPKATTTSAGRVAPPALVARAPSASPGASSAAATTEPDPSAPSEPPPSEPAPSVPAPGADPSAPPGTQPGDPAAQVPPALQKQFGELDCSKPEARAGGGADDPEKPLVTCNRDGSEKYVLGKAEMKGTDVKTASAGLGTNSQGQAIAGSWEVNLEFTGDGTKRWSDLTTATVQQRVAIVLDGLVVSAPVIQEPITGGQARISGSFTQQDSTELANVLKYGALPLTFEAGTAQEVSPSLGSDQLRGGLLAGGIGLILVVLYSLLYYRGLGLVTILSLLASALLTYGGVVLLGNLIGFRLSLAGIAGLIVAIGIAADSFVVYFERLRDEVREGKTLRVAVETGWRRARRTILAADFVSFLAAVILYILSVGAVKGFAFTLGLTTVLDIVVVFLFTKPVITLLARTKFFGGGHPLSGLDPKRLGGGPRPAPRVPLRRRPVPTAKEA